MPTNSHQNRLEAACAMARDAGALALDYFRNRGSLTVERKGLQDEVTIADRAVESFIRGAIERHFPGDAVLGEEEGKSVV